jgi:hypothetical protein
LRAPARHRHVDATGNHHGRAGEPEQHRDTGANSIAVAHRDSVTIAVAHPDRHADEDPRDTHAAGARSVLRRR